MLSIVAYNLVLIAALPILLGWVIWRLAIGKSRVGWRHRLGLIKDDIKKAESCSRDADKRIWIHACSVGEVNAVRPVIAVLRERLPRARIFLSVITPTGAEQAKRACKEVDTIFYFPFDIFPCMSWAIEAVAPDLCILTEKELWPNFLAICKRRQIPVLVVNGIVSERTLSRTRWCKGFVRWLVGMVTFFSVQTEQYQQRLLQLGVNAAQIAVDGNTKFDQPTPEPDRERELQRILGWDDNTRGFVAGSTHAGEEELVLEAYQQVRRKYPKVRLIIAPRHPERAEAIGKTIEDAGLRFVRRSKISEANSVNKAAYTQSAIVILDTIGELQLAYRLARAAFVGGTIVRHVGGHNPLEVLSEGRPACFGPHTSSCQDIADLLCDEKIAFIVRNEQELTDFWIKAIENEAWAEEISRRAKSVLSRHRGGAIRAAQRALRLFESASKSTYDKKLALDISDEPERTYQSAAIDAQLSPTKKYLLEVITLRRHDILAKITRFILSLLSYCYAAGLSINLALYDFRLFRRERFSVPIISIGNLTLGGTGKTLAVDTICRWLISKGFRPAILSRGYGGKSGPPRLVFDGKNLSQGPNDVGDEPFLLAVSLPQVKVFVGKDRRRSAHKAIALGCDVLILDDGAQYWKIEKDFEIFLVDALNPFSNERLLPRGLLREPLNALNRASAIWITHSDLIDNNDLQDLEERLKHLVPGTPISKMVHQPLALRDFITGEGIGTWTLEGKNIIALSGLGNPFSFEQMLKKLGAQIIPARFPDHHQYQKEDLARVLAKAKDVGMIVTTAKDAVRIPSQLDLKKPLRVMEIQLSLLQGSGTKDLQNLLEENLNWLELSSHSSKLRNSK